MPAPFDEARRRLDQGSRNRPGAGSLTGNRRQGSKAMREHSGAEGKDNNRDPTLKEAEAARGRSGEALLDKPKRPTAGRKGTARP
jgi:hypothetical protein